MKAFLQPLEQLEDIVNLRETMKKKPALYDIAGCIDSAKAHLIYGVGYDTPVKLVVTQDESRAKQLVEELSFFEENVQYYPAKDFLFYQSDIRGGALTRQRMRVVDMLRRGDPLTVVTTWSALMNKLPVMDSFRRSIIRVDVDTVMSVDQWRRSLTGMGYGIVSQVEHPGEFAVRGGIIDVYPLTEDYPIRIELFDDEIDSIRRFNPESQTSLPDEEPVESVTIGPAAEMVLSPEELEAGLEAIRRDADHLSETYRREFRTEEAHRVKSAAEQLIEETDEGFAGQEIESHLTYFTKELASLIDYIPEDGLIVLDEFRHLKESGEAVTAEFRDSMKHRLEGGYILPGQMEMLYTNEELFAKLARRSGITLTTLDQRNRDLPIANCCHFHVSQGNVYNNSYETLKKDLARHKKNHMRVVYVGTSRTRAKHLAEDLSDEDLNVFFTEDPEHEVKPSEVMVTVGTLSRGYEIPDAAFIVITEQDIFGTRAARRKKKRRRYEGEAISSFTDLHVGDYVVHENHGLGIYRGMEKIEVDHVMKDYLRIEYDKGGTLYILASQLDMLQKYAGSDAKKPKLNTLGTQEWAKTKSRVKTAVTAVAKELVDLYAVRQQENGYQFGPDTVWQKEFEEGFPYEETEGQLEAIEAVKRDMESPKIMDRLICGDVGYGKTEIALRAAFKAVQESKQVVYLAPTTILAQQIYDTFVQRMSQFAVNIGLLCRFRTPAQQKETIRDLKSGRSDIVVGTHRVLSKDVEFHDLGLLIIDEEQRFGVAHKEKIKQMKKNIDVLSLSATPIPRTLHMSLVGIRDMSVLEEAPMERVPIQTFIFEYNEEIVREAILREMARGGQVYYVFNRVAQIADMASQIAKLVPEATVAYAHGKMSQNRLEEIMYDFINGDIDVLVSTTIIEIGLDISNVNTIIIHDSDNLGLSQLYQLRGRVGRSNRTAYAFFMYRRGKMLKEVAEKRLAAIREFSDLGSGFKIAMRDLEIRGAGNMLGEAQSGHMAAVGYDLYCKMLNEAVRHEKGEEVVDPFETTVDIAIDAFIPENYIEDESQRMDIYKRIADIRDEDEHAAMMDELIDRFGDPPRAVQNLLWIALFKAEAHRAWITDIRQREDVTRFTLYREARINPVVIPALISRFQPYLSFAADQAAPSFTMDLSKNKKIDRRTAPEYMRSFVRDLYELAVEK